MDDTTTTGNQQQGQSMPPRDTLTGQDPFTAQQGAQGQAAQQGQTQDSSAPPPPPPKPANFQLGSKLSGPMGIKVPAHQLQFDEQYFLNLLAGSISLTKDEKARIIESIPKLKQTQIDELIRIFEEERHKFAELGEEHVPQLEKLAQQHYEDWIDIQMRQQQTSKADEDAQKAEEIRKQLGL